MSTPKALLPSLLLSGILLFCCQGEAQAAVYTGDLLYENWGAVDTGLEVVSANADGWGNYTKVAWKVSDQEPGKPASHPIYYEYTITVRKYALSHAILETSDNFGTGDITQVEVDGQSHTNYAINTHDPNAGSPDMPEALYGVKVDDLGGGFDAGGGNVAIVISFFSNRLPVWGDIYMKCGGYGNRAWNEGFTTADTDPPDPPANGSVLKHVLVPDSVVPEPGSTALLVAASASLLGASRRRRSRAAR